MPKTAVEWYRWVAGGFGALLLILISGGISHHLTSLTNISRADVAEIVEQKNLTKEQVRGIIKEETLTSEEMRILIREAVATSFTDISKDKGMYVLEGRPKLEALNARLELLEERLSKELREIQISLEKIEGRN